MTFFPVEGNVSVESGSVSMVSGPDQRWPEPYISSETFVTGSHGQAGLDPVSPKEDRPLKISRRHGPWRGGLAQHLGTIEDRMDGVAYNYSVTKFFSERFPPTLSERMRRLSSFSFLPPQRPLL